MGVSFFLLFLNRPAMFWTMMSKGTQRNEENKENEVIKVEKKTQKGGVINGNWKGPAEEKKEHKV